MDCQSTTMQGHNCIKGKIIGIHIAQNEGQMDVAMWGGIEESFYRSNT